ncbi:MAG: phosphoribosylformimino-5-aminoimidazole carboxamide ribotide isomerase [Clostridiales bacterium]|nr:phosphoribosylformimino-5-aminoimidazole carboxamide ribotide isomerase [Candidatus Scatonaster coprocaballi]
MEFRPCIDIHNGKVKQIVGGTLDDSGAKENFVSERSSAYFAKYYQELGIRGGHIIMLNKVGTPEYEASKSAAMEALEAYPGGMQVGGGIQAENAGAFIEAGASHVIVTSYVFSDGMINYEHLRRLVEAVGREHIVLDLSCRKKEDKYYIVTDRWQRFTETVLSAQVLRELAYYCDEYLVHAVDVEGKAAGPDAALFDIFQTYLKEATDNCPIRPITYAGGIHSYDDIRALKEVSDGRVNITVGSALDLFGGTLNSQAILTICEA